VANEITLTGKLKFAKGSVLDRLDVDGLAVTVTGTTSLHNVQKVGTVEEALLLGDAGVGGYFCGVNRHATAVIEIRSGTGATDLVEIQPGELALFRISGDATAPYVISTVNNAELEYLLVAD